MELIFKKKSFFSLKKNKKAFLFMFLGIIFLTLFAFLFLTFNEDVFQDKQNVISVRIRSMDNFIVDLNADLDRAAYITGFRAMIAVEEYLTIEGSFFANISDMEIAFSEAFMNGTIDGSSFGIMANSSFNEYLSRVKSQASLIGLDLNLSLKNVSIKQDDPWSFHVLFTGSVHLSDVSGIAFWSFDDDFETLIPIFGLRDPLYAVNTNGDVSNTISAFVLPPEGFVTELNDTEQLKLFVQGSFYRESNSSPSFLQRFTNDLSPSQYGIESLVDLASINLQHSFVYTNRSVVDYIYFSESPNSSSDRCQIQNMIFSPDWFRLDAEHLSDYEVDTLTSVPCP